MMGLLRSDGRARGGGSLAGAFDDVQLGAPMAAGAGELPRREGGPAGGWGTRIGFLVFPCARSSCCRYCCRMAWLMVVSVTTAFSTFVIAWRVILNT